MERWREGEKGEEERDIYIYIYDVFQKPPYHRKGLGLPFQLRHFLSFAKTIVIIAFAACS